MVEQGSEPFLLPFLCCFSHTVQSWDMRFPLCVGCMLNCAMFSFICALPSPTSAELLLLCSPGSQVLRHSVTSPARTRPHYGLWPSRTGLDGQTKACWRSPGSRACCFLSVRGFLDYAGPVGHSRVTQPPYCPSSLRNGVGILIFRLFEARSPAHQCLFYASK